MLGVHACVCVSSVVDCRIVDWSPALHLKQVRPASVGVSTLLHLLHFRSMALPFTVGRGASNNDLMSLHAEHRIHFNPKTKMPLRLLPGGAILSVFIFGNTAPLSLGSKFSSRACAGVIHSLPKQLTQTFSLS